jgi:hypothetical protein
VRSLLTSGWVYALHWTHLLMLSTCGKYADDPVAKAFGGGGGEAPSPAPVLRDVGAYWREWVYAPGPRDSLFASLASPSFLALRRIIRDLIQRGQDERLA